VKPSYQEKPLKGIDVKEEWSLSMKPDDRRRLGGLLDSITERESPFLDRCLETKYLAVTDPIKASLEYCTMAKEVLEASEFTIPKSYSDRKKSIIEHAIDNGHLNKDFLQALKDLRSNYLDDVLRPAVRSYMGDSRRHLSEVEYLYENAMKIDGLIEVGTFLNRVQDS
jgi:hypothetical protein